MTTVLEQATHPLATEPQSRLDRWLSRLADFSNPILVKELRQAIKSRQFFWTFLLMLICVVAWSILGLVIENSSVGMFGPQMIMGYFFILAFPLTIVVPFSAFRSLAREYEDDTIHLIRITTMSAQQIVWGKLSSAMVQMSVYFFAIVPCLMFAYLLQGVEIWVIGLLLVTYFVVSVMLTSMALVAAGLTRNLFFRVTINLVLIVGLFISFAYTLGVTGSLLENGLRFSGHFILDAWYLVLLVGVALTWLNLQLTHGLVSFVAENRSSRVRSAIGMLHLTLLALFLAMALEEFPGPAEVATVAVFLSATFWTLVGSMTSTERSLVSLRSRREFPKSWLGQMWRGLLLPGPGRGYLFALSQLTAWALVLVIGSSWAESRQLAAGGIVGASWFYIDDRTFFMSVYNWLQAAFYLGMVYWLNRLFAWRSRRELGPGLGFTLLVFLFVFVNVSVVSHYAIMDSFAMDSDWGTGPVVWNWWVMQASYFDRAGFGDWLTRDPYNFAWGMSLIVVSVGITIVTIYQATRELTISRTAVPQNVLDAWQRRESTAEAKDSFEELIRRRQAAAELSERR